MTAENTVLGQATAGSPAVELLSGPASALRPTERLLELIGADECEEALALNAAIAGEVPFIGAIECWFLKQIGGTWDETALSRAQDHWAEAKRNAPELREVCEAGVRGWAKSLRATSRCAVRLAGLAARLEAARPKIEDAK